MLKRSCTLPERSMHAHKFDVQFLISDVQITNDKMTNGVPTSWAIKSGNGLCKIPDSP